MLIYRVHNVGERATESEVILSAFLIHL